MWQLLIGAAAGYVAGKSARGSTSFRPAVKVAMKAGVRAFEKGAEAMAHLRESLDDIAAEVRADLETQQAAAEQFGEEERQRVSQDPEDQRSSSHTTQQPEAEAHASRGDH
jgi:hypothetical protein